MEDFVRKETPEPHAERRKRLLRTHPEIRKLYGYDRRTAWVTIAVVAVQFMLAAFITAERATGSIFGSLLFVVPFAYLVGGTLSHWLSMSIHETSHRAAAKTAAGNTAVALFANLPMVLPVAMSFNRYHLDHHRKLGVLGEDTDLPTRWEVRFIGHSAWRKALWLLLHPIVYLARATTFAKRPNGKELANIALMVGMNIAIYFALGPMALVYLGLSFYFAHSLHPAAAHFVHEHYTFAEGQETFSYYGPLNLVTFNVGYHNEHHDFMNIPGWRLPALKKLVAEYDDLVSHRSWTAILYRFITDKTVGYSSRIVRSRAAYLKGRKGVQHAAA